MKNINPVGPYLTKTKLFCLVAVIAFVALFSSCKKEGNTVAAVVNEKVDLAVAKPASAINTFAGGLVTGTATVYQTNGKYQLALESFNSASGPDLYVYLSKGEQPTNFINLGKLKALSGSMLYDIPETVNVKDYSHALIYCQSYNHLYGYAKLTF